MTAPAGSCGWPGYVRRNELRGSVKSFEAGPPLVRLSCACGWMNGKGNLCIERIEIPECSASAERIQSGYGHEGFVKTAPSTQMVWPLMKEDSGPARKTTAWPTSLGNPTRPSGASLDHVAAKSPPSRAVLSTSMAPGATQLTRMP